MSNYADNILKKINKLENSNRPTSKLKEKLENLKTSINDHSDIISKKYYHDIIKKNPNNSWKILNTILGSINEHVNISLIVGDNMIDDDEQIANLFNQKFQLTSSNNQCDTIFNLNEKESSDSMYFDAVSYEEIEKIILELDPGKASGSDMIPAKIIMELKDFLVLPLTCLINKIIMEAAYPDSLKYAIIKPLHKKGDVNSINNYRPIALLPIINKIIEKIISNRMQEFLMAKGINDSEQFGYKKKIGTNDAILKFSSQISKSLDMGEIVIVIFMDLTAAFDTLNRDVLIRKLFRLGIRGQVLSLIKSYFDNRTQAVKVGSATSDVVGNDIGVPQGSVLGPILFNINLFDSPDIT